MILNVSINNNNNRNITLKDIVNTVNSQSEINPECPNGCLAQCGNACYCYKFYEYLKEARWPN